MSSMPAMVTVPATSARDFFLHRRLRSGESVPKTKWKPSKYNCPDCERTFDIRASLVRHRTYECDDGTNQNKQSTTTTSTNVAGKHDRKRQTRTLRKKVAPKENEQLTTIKTKIKRSFTCSKCNKSYKFFTSLWRHRNYECDVQPKFACKYCASKFTQKSNLDRHLRAKHPNADDSQSPIHPIQAHRQPPPDVSSLNRSYVFSGFVDNIPPMQQRTNSLSSWQCQQCGKSYSLRQNLMKHVRFECGGRKHFGCRLCSSRYTQKASLARHLLNRHNYDLRKHKRK
ncbi:zinc finger protein 224-like [Copidosoma floridanum]|uniref:zinc finger protein 224-like n=1 Tax=Copidosoma floridanum TaxID=29053 RepID=UPI0006C9CF7B|nr:zinc finger protein 224-like [Copidosoma floridanum]